MTYITDTRHASAPRSGRPAILNMIAVWKQRRQLRALDDRALNDIGITRQDALTEASRPVWNVPMHWLR